MGRRRRMTRAKRDTYPYALKDGNKVVYYGITNDTQRRKQEHRDAGMRFTRMERDNVCSRETALKREQNRIKRYQRNHGGRKPRYND